MNKFDGRVALVTGAARGIGAAVARRLAAEGAQVAVADLSSDGAMAVAERIRHEGGRATAYPVDVSQAADVQSLVEQVEKEQGLVEMAVTAAGIIKTYDFIDLPADVWDRTMNVNLKGTFLVFQAIARRLLAAKKTGSLIAISSVAGRGGRANAVDYAASKAAVISVVRSAALALAKSGITVNAVCPGIVDTEMTRNIHEERARIAGITPEESLQKLAANIPLGRIQKPEDVADLVSFLLSKEGSYITGQAINTCGGLEMD
jgi:NAD(P)-dependent dehydrogenase (short-subunit alcohol dehydrogenase family)